MAWIVVFLFLVLDDLSATQGRAGQSMDWKAQR